MRFSLEETAIRVDAETAGDVQFLNSLAFTQEARLGLVGSGGQAGKSPAYIRIGSLRLPSMAQENATFPLFPPRQTEFRHAFAAVFGDKWEQLLTPSYCAGYPAYSHVMTTLLMIFAAQVVQEEWPKAIPARSIDVVWGIWYKTFTSEELVQWHWYHGACGYISACHQPTDWITSAFCYQFSEVLCRAFLYQAWLIATAEGEEQKR